MLASCKNNIRAWFGALAITSLLISPAAYSLTETPRSFDELVQLSDMILVGTVQDVRSEFANGGLDQNTIFSYVSLSDLKILKGQVATTEYVLRVPGGVVGRFAQDYPGIPSFQIGQRYLVFIRGNNRDLFPVVGISQGMYRILSNTQGQQIVIPEDQLALHNQRSLTTMSQNAPTLDSFINSIHGQLKQTTPTPTGVLP